MTLFNTLFRSGRTTPTPTPTSRLEPPATPPNTSARPGPPSAYKTTQAPSPMPTPSTPRAYLPPAPVKVRDFAIPPTHDLSRRLPDLPLPPTPDTSALSTHRRSVSNASSIISKKGTKTPPKSSHPPTAFAPPRHHQRAQSGPSPSATTRTDVRARSATIQPLTAVQPIRTAQVGDNDPLSHSVPSQSAPAASSTRLAETKRRPVALILRSSNLIPTRSPTRSKHLPHPVPCPDIHERNPIPSIDRQGVRAPDAEPLRPLPTPDGPSGPALPPKQSFKGLSEVAVRDLAERRIAQSHDNPPTKRDETPQPVRPSAPKSPFLQPTTAESVSPPSISHTPPHMFPHVPLPWSSSSASQLSRELGHRFDNLIEYTLNHLPPSSPRVLRPSILKTSAAEDARLRSELVKLQDKHAALVAHRDGLLASLVALGVYSDGSGGFKKTVESLQKATNRCDRLARQIFICSDQIRQIEVQGEEHVVGTLRVALERAQGISSWSSDTASSMTREMVEAVVQPVNFEPTNRSGSLDKDTDDSNRISTATVISLNQLGFPLPPVRNTPSPSGSSVTLPRLAEVSQPLERFSSETIRSASTSQLHVTVDPPDEIVIYPPGHRRSFSAPLLGLPDLDLPHTPWRGQPDSTASTGTRPLRLRPGGKRAGGKAKSMAHKRRSSDTLRRVHRGRESQLEAPGSILLSLATAGLWTKQEAKDDKTAQRC